MLSSFPVANSAAIYSANAAFFEVELFVVKTYTLFAHWMFEWFDCWNFVMVHQPFMNVC